MCHIGIAQLHEYFLFHVDFTTMSYTKVTIVIAYGQLLKVFIAYGQLLKVFVSNPELACSWRDFSRLNGTPIQ